MSGRIFGAVCAFCLTSPALAVGTVEEGKLLKIEGQTLTIDVKGDKERQRIVTKETKISVDGKDATLADLKPGMMVKYERPGTSNRNLIKLDASSK